MMRLSNEFCEKVAVSNKNIMAAYVLEDGAISQWTLSPAATVPRSVERIQAIVTRSI